MPPLLGRDALFESCLFEGVTYDGEIESRSGAPDTQALTVTTSDGTRRTLSGGRPVRHLDSLLRLTREWHRVGDARLETSSPDGEFVVDVDGLDFRHGFIVDGGVWAYDAYLSIRASFASPTSGGVAIEVSTSETLDYREQVAYSSTTDEWNFTAGSLHLAAADGSALVLVADTGGLPTPAEAAAHARVVVTDPAGARADGTPELEFSGQVTEHYPSYTNDGYRAWRLRDVRIARGDDGVVVEDATTSFGSGARTSQREFNAHLGGRFVLRSPETGGRAVLVETLKEFDLTATLYDEDYEPVSDPAIDSQRFTGGRLRVSAGDGSVLLLEAAPGEDGAVAITFTDGDATSTLRAPWSVWPEVLRPL